MRRTAIHILILVLFAIMPRMMSAQVNTVTSAGTDFYFAVLDHWRTVYIPDEDYFFVLTITATQEADVHLEELSGWTGDYHVAANSSRHIRMDRYVMPWSGIHLTCTAPCFVNVWIHGPNRSAESAILPTNLLGTHYMLQGVAGSRIEINGATPYTYPQFLVVGTEDNTTITVTPKNELKCVHNNQVVQGAPATFTLDRNHVLLFETTDGSSTISGTEVSSDKPVAVFQGNDITRISATTNDADYVWEQARPTSSWGKEFVITRSTELFSILFKPIALYDNTVLNVYKTDGSKWVTNMTLQKGNVANFGMEDNDTSPTPHSLYMVASQPIACYLYTQGCKENRYNNTVGDPSMVEITPIDKVVTEARWALDDESPNTPYKARLFVATQEGNAENVLLNGQPLPAYYQQHGGSETIFEGQAAYELPIATNGSGELRALRGGFSAYILKLGKTAEASAFNISFATAPQVDITVPSIVCAGDAARLVGEFTNDGSLAEPVEYQWHFSSDNKDWFPIAGADSIVWISKATDESYSGWYSLSVSGANGSGTIVSIARQMTVNQCDPPRPDLCMDGVLLYREDFGGNDPNDPSYYVGNAPGMSSEYRNIQGGGMFDGGYFITKKGYRNGIQWHLQDDHTYPYDYTRGYFLEVDGKGGNAAFYSTTIDNLCEGTKMTFSAYIVNVTYAGQIPYLQKNFGYVYPRIKFVLTDPATGQVLATERTGNIEADDTKVWDINLSESAHWQLVGMNFVVPPGISAIQMTIYNDTEGGVGNDFGLDDIEIRACFPPVKIKSDSVICTDARNRFDLDFVNDGSLAEPLEYQWFYTTDTALGWTTIDDATQGAYTPHYKAIHTGWYRAAVSGTGNIASATCSAWSDPFYLRIDSNCVDLCDQGTLLFREDFGGNDPDDARVSTTPVPGMSYQQVTTDAWLSMGTGKYIVTKSGYCNGDTAHTNSPNNRRSQWFLQDDHTYPDDYSRGYFMEVDGKGDRAVFYSTTIEGLCAGSDLSFLAYVANVELPWYYVDRPWLYIYPRLTFTLIDPATQAVLATYMTGNIPYDSTYMEMQDWNHSSVWRQVGVKFTVPPGVEAITLQIANDASSGSGNDFAIDDIEIRLCMPPVTIAAQDTLCRKYSHTLQASFRNDGSVVSPEYLWEFSSDSVVWEPLQTGPSEAYEIPVVHKSNEGWYRIAVASAGNINSPHCRSFSEPIRLDTRYCYTAGSQYIDTTACDTLLPIEWRTHDWPAVGSVIDTLRDVDEDDSLYLYLTLHTKICCPDIEMIRHDTVVCDTLLPFTWSIDGYTFVFDKPQTQALAIEHERWENCTGQMYSVTLDTVHCEKLWPVIVNKYNWVLLLDNVRLQLFFPSRTAQAFQWYKDGVAVVGATEDDYSESDELHGVFQLRIQLDGGETIWSNIIELLDTQEPLPVVKRIYNSQGMLVGEEQMTRGVYLIYYQQGENYWTEKKIVL